MRVLLDECIDWRLSRSIVGHDVKTAHQMSWASIKNGELLKLAAERFTLVSLTMAFTLSVASCGQVPAQRAAGAPAPGVRSGALWNEPQFTTMLQAYRRKLPGKCRALRFEMTESGASLQVQDSAELANVVSYDYKGAVLSGPSPVDLAGVLGYSDLADELFDWDQVAVERIPTLVKVALSRTKLAGTRVVQVKITRKAPTSAELARRIEAHIDAQFEAQEAQMDARLRAMEQKLRQVDKEVWGRNPADGRTILGGEPRGGKNAQRPVLAPLAVEISLRLQVPWGFAWLTADASGTITGSGQQITGPPDSRRGMPYWRRAAGLDH